MHLPAVEAALASTDLTAVHPGTGGPSPTRCRDALPALAARPIMPLHPFALAVLLLALPPALDLLAQARPQPQQATPLPSLQRGPEALALRRIEATQQLPGGGFAAVKVAGRDALYYLSNDGRILIKGTAYDLWSGRTLSDARRRAALGHPARPRRASRPCGRSSTRSSSATARPRSWPSSRRPARTARA